MSSEIVLPRCFECHVTAVSAMDFFYCPKCLCDCGEALIVSKSSPAAEEGK